MGRYQPLPSDLFGDGRRHLFVFAHQDDDLPYGGLLQRARDNAQVVWVTNGDGLAPSANMAPHEYAKMRNGEALAAMRMLGYEPGQLHFLGHSELFFYPLFIELKEARDDDSIPGHVRDKALGAAVAITHALRPLVAAADVVWTLAWQGGHPEHDLTHFLTVEAVKAVESQSGRRIPIYELPAYELTVAVPLRFAPWHRGVRHRICLTPDELGRKEAAFTAYRSQAELTALFKRLITLYGVLSTLRLKPFTFRGFARNEDFAPVPRNRDYTRSPHRHELLDYMFEDYQGNLVSFTRSIARFIKLVRGS